MANSISTQQTVTSVIDGVRTTLSSNNTTVTTSSNFIAGGQNVTSAGWTSLSLGATTDIICLTVLNDNSVNTGSTIQVTGSSTTFPIGMILIPGAQATIPWSGSMVSIAAKVVSGYPVGTPTPSAGTVQWLGQQS